MVDQKDLVVSMMAAASVFAGVILVVLGFTIVSPDREGVEQRYARQRVQKSCQLVFTYNVISVVLCALWLFSGAYGKVPEFFFFLVTIYFFGTLGFNTFLVVRAPQLVMQR